MTARSPNEQPSSRVLVVDDNRDNRELLARRLVRRGYQAHAVDGGAAALAALDDESFDLVLLDIEMPEMSGLDVLAELRKRFSKGELPVVMATARTGSDDMVEAFRLGANDYVTKPLDFPVVVARVESQLSLRRELLESQPPPIVLTAGEDLPPGAVIDGRYRVDAELGEGGFAIVYAGVQLSSGLPVAIKLLRSQRMFQTDTASELARFALEMRVIARVAHPAVVRLVDSGTLTVRSRSMLPSERSPEMATTRLSVAPGESPPRTVSSRRHPTDREHHIPYIVMEKLSGDTLATLLADQGPLSPSRAIDILLPILDGLHVVHEEGIIHRDAKPSNIVLAEIPGGQLEPKILDFGIAKLMDEEDDKLTKTASVIGTPIYMAPEQATASPLDGRCDQYTLATVLFECLTGRTPCAGTSSVAILQQVAEGSRAQQSLKDASLDEGLHRVLSRALARDPADRFPDARAFGEALLPFASPTGTANWQRLRALPPSGIKPAH